ncbi:amino acid ABC transporter permease [Arthrobacter sedimenti]|uniref:amino acid ABC transporter permease n=1 Tax=Arthrobacter sedimenti TaxID=2694931 RepID=UPI000B363574|nr:amino acid ABC transporter permease [Arthrobacter sedimenti]OUM44637.1 amino acid ABC transporter permease [Arthrobacter agilis]
MDALEAVILGVPLTLLITAASLLIGVVLGVPLVMGLRSHGILRIVCRSVVNLLRGIPAIVWLFIIYFGVSIGAYQFSAVPAAILGLGLISAAYMAEIYRGGISAVHSGQWEASQALGVSHWTTFSRVIGPQALRVSIPSMASYAISLLKDSSIASTIGVTEIVFLTTREARSGGGGLTVYILAALLYVALSIPLGLLSRKLDASLRKKVSR